MPPQIFLTATPVATQSLNATKDNFFDLVGSQPVLIKFVAPQCGPNMADVWDELAELHQGSSLVIASVDCSDQSVVCSQYGVTEFPAVLSFVAGEYTGAKYHGEMDKASLEAFASELASECDPRGSQTYKECSEEQKRAFSPLILDARYTVEQLIAKAKDVQQVIRKAEAAYARAVKRWRAEKTVAKKDEHAQAAARARDKLVVAQKENAPTLRRLKAAMLARDVKQEEHPKNFFPRSVGSDEVEDAVAACAAAAGAEAAKGEEARVKKGNDGEARVKGDDKPTHEGAEDGAENHTHDKGATSSCESSATRA
jgi:thioredoxin-like negative regulator of GroEL